MARLLVSLGSNLGDAGAALDAAEAGLRALTHADTLRTSGRRQTTPVGGPAGQGAFLNAAAAFESDATPLEVLAALQRIESGLDRNRDQRWGARTLDLDLLLYDERIVSEERLRIPHPRMTYRPFVLEPAAEIAGDWRHPECGQTLAELLARLQTGRDAVRLVDDDGRIARWIAEARNDNIPVESGETSDPPRLTVDARRTYPGGGRPGPRLALADCPPEHWRDEVLAALECVWPSGPRACPSDAP